MIHIVTIKDKIQLHKGEEPANAIELLKTCEEYFSKNMIEGIVVRSLDGKFSSKIMNLAYDALK